MPKLQHEIKINAPIKKVWSVLIDLEQVGAYNPLVKSVKYITDNRTGVGASRECHFQPNGSSKERITALDEMKSISMEMYESDWPLQYMKWTNYLTSDNGTTSLKTVTEYKMKFGILGTVMDTMMMKPKFKKTLNELFISLKKHVEK